MTSRSRYGLLAGIAGTAAAVFMGDVLTPSGIEVWVFYLPVVLSLVLVGDRRVVLAGGGCCSAFVVVSRFVSPAGSNPAWWDDLNRGMGLAAIWLTATAGYALCARSAQLACAMAELHAVSDSYRRTAEALQASEAGWRLAMEGGGLGTRDADLRTGREVWSDTQFRILGYTTVAGGAATAAMWADRVHPDDRQRVAAAKARARADRGLYRLEHRVCRPGQAAPAWVEVFGRFRYDPMGEAVRFVGVCFDVTARKDLERELLEITARQQLGFGHELHDGVGQELTGLGLMAQALAQQLGPDRPERRVADRLADGLERVHRSVRDLSRGLVPVDLDRRGLSTALAELAARTGEQTGVAVTCECPDGVELPGHATATHLFRVAQEAVANALRHGRPRAVRLSLVADPRQLRLRVADDGCGYQPRPGRPEGLGLRIMRYRAGLVGGSLEVGPGGAGGTVVTFTLPWGPPDAA